MIMTDDRTSAERATHTILVGGTDRFMSGWGKAAGGNSFAFWACVPDNERAVRQWVESRRDIMRFRVLYSPPGRPYRPSGNCVHCHIYTVHEAHNALK